MTQLASSIYREVTVLSQHNDDDVDDDEDDAVDSISRIMKTKEMKFKHAISMTVDRY